jgi:poly-gamma-glutamate capsule biosynthesis protein CapA/YwtB (metallophosphatase superfamily)
MNRNWGLKRRFYIAQVVIAAFLHVNVLMSITVFAQSADPEVADPNFFDSNRPLAQELQMSVRDGFTLAAVGDCIISRPLSQYAESKRDEGFEGVVKILRQSDATYGNLETTIFDIREFKGYPYSWEGDWTLVSEPWVAKDLAQMGFDLFSRANNHALDWGVEGMRETTRWLDQAGLVHAGAGENLGLAGVPHYFESSKGRIGIVSMASTFRPTSNALPSEGAAPGRPGINGLGVKTITVVPADAMAKLQDIARMIQPKKSQKDEPKRNATSQNQNKLSLFGKDFEVGKAFGYRYEMDPADLAGILKNIREGKQNCDFLIVTIHAHESSNDTFLELPADFLKDLARAAIDAGADAFMTTGIHHLGPIEVYKSRPIFYGLANFFWSDIQEPLPADLHQKNRDLLAQAFKHPEKATDADLTAVLNARSFANDLIFQTVVTESRFEKSGLSEIRLYPVDLGYGRKLTESGIPRLASPGMASQILKRLQDLSAPYDTKILIENNIGIIRP